MTVTTSITVDALRATIERDEPLTILDVRPVEERAEWTIPGSLHVDAYERLKAGDRHVLDGIALPDTQPVVTVCAAGRTSLIAADLLRERGIEALSLDGGMKAWSLAWNTAEVPVPGSSARVIQVRRTGKGCLSYVIGRDGEALVVDASLDTDVYIRLATEHGWDITTVLDTHIHADHLSRSRLLADQTGAALFMPAQNRARYPYHPLRAGDMLSVGGSTLRAIATPGHTNESMTYLLDERALFTGDTLFLAGVGRPDLEATTDESRQRATALHGSLQQLMQLPPDMIVLPGHVSEPVPFDGEPLAATLDEVRERVALLREDRDGFVSAILGRIPPTPPNHHVIVEANEAGVLPAGDVTDLEAGANRCAVS